MMSRVARLHAPLRACFCSIAQAQRGARRAPLSGKGRGRARLALGCLLALTLPAFAEDAPQPDKSGEDAQTSASAHVAAPHGMVRYPKPILHNGRMILWHGAWRGGHGRMVGHPRPGRVAVAAQPSAQVPDTTLAAKTTGPRVLSILADSADPTAMRLAGELAGLMSSDDADVKAIAGVASRAAIAKAIGADSADFALLPLDAVADPVQGGADWRPRAPYIARLHNEEIELIAPRSIADIRQLAGRKVNVGPADGAAAASANLIFSRLNISASWTNLALTEALERLKDGKIDAVLVVGGRDSEVLANFGDDGRFHLAAITYAPALRPYYAPERATATNWPKLVAADEKVETLSAPMALVAIDGANPERAGRLAPAADRFLAHFDQLLDDAKDAGWREVNLAARIEQLPRFGAAQAWLDQNKSEANADLDAFREMARAADAESGGPSGADSDRLYQSLMHLSGAGR
jgi:TRAP-type uncharacterized transport system substrate-binding protein